MTVLLLAAALLVSGQRAGGAAADNVAFVRAHRTAVDETLTDLAIEIR